MVEKSIQIGDTSLYYKEFGVASDATLLILHGWGGSSESWIKCAELLSQNNFHIIVPDLPGFGKTNLLQAFTLDDYAQTIEQLYKALQLSDIILWGHSNGGAIATTICSRGNMQVDRLILNNSAGIRRDPKRNLKRLILGGLVRVVKIFKNIPGFHKLRIVFYKAIGSHDYLNAERNNFLAQTYQNMITSDLQGIFPNIQTPTTLIWGSQDTYTPVSDAHKIGNLLPNSSLVILKGEKHGIHLQNSSALVDTFLKTL